MVASALTTVPALVLALVCLGVFFRPLSVNASPLNCSTVTPATYTYGPWGYGGARCMGNQVTGFYSISSVTYFLSHRSGSSLQVSAVIIGGGNTLIDSVDISPLLLPTTSAWVPVQATFSGQAVLDPSATYMVAFCATGAGDGQYNMWIDFENQATGFCYSSFSDCVTHEPNWGLAANALGTILQGSCTPPSPSPTSSPSSTRSASPTPSNTPSNSPTPSISRTPSPTSTPTRTPTPTPTRTPSSTPYPSGALSACGPGANIVNGTVVGAYGYGGWGYNAAGCLGNQVTGYQSISSVAFTFDHRSGSSLQAAAVIIGGGNLFASADISALLPASGTAQVKATFASAPVVLDSQATYFVAACVTGAGDSQYNLLATDGPTAAAFCYGSFETCKNAPYWGLSSLAVGTVIEGSCPGASASPTPSPTPLTCTYPSLGNCSSSISLSNVTEAMVKSYLGSTIAASVGPMFSWSNGWSFVKSAPNQFSFSFTASEPAYKGWAYSMANDLALAIETTLSKYCYGSTAADQDAYSTQICPPKPTPTPLP